MISDFNPATLGLNGINLKVSTSQPTVGTLMDLSDLLDFGLSFVYTITGTATAGTVKVQAVIYSSDGVTQLSEAIDILTVSPTTQADSTYRAFVGWNAFLAPSIVNGAATATYTLGTPEKIRGKKNVLFQTNVSVAFNSTTALGYVYLTGR